MEFRLTRCSEAIFPPLNSVTPHFGLRDRAMWWSHLYALDTVLLRSKSPSEVCSGFFSRAWENVRMLSFVKRGLPSRRLFFKRNEVIIVGQSGGGWGSIALGSQNPESVRAIIGFAAGRGGRLNGKPNNNCAPDQLVDAVAEFGRTARVPMLWIYNQNDTYFGPDLSKRMAEAFRAAGGNVEYHLLPDFGGDGHFLIDSADAVQLWAPIVSEFLAKHP